MMDRFITVTFDIIRGSQVSPCVGSTRGIPVNFSDCDAHSFQPITVDVARPEIGKCRCQVVCKYDRLPGYNSIVQTDRQTAGLY